MTTDVNELQKLIMSTGLASYGDFVGCSPAEIREVETGSKVVLPRFYAQFLETMGRGAGGFLKGSSVFYPELLRLRGYAEDLLREGGTAFQLGERDFVFYVHQGYQFAYFHADVGDDDPPVWCFEEGWETPKERWGSLSAFFLAVARDQGVLP